MLTLHVKSIYIKALNTEHWTANVLWQQSLMSTFICGFDFLWLEFSSLNPFIIIRFHRISFVNRHLTMNRTALKQHRNSSVMPKCLSVKTCVNTFDILILFESFPCSSFCFFHQHFPQVCMRVGCYCIDPFST